MTDSSKDFRGKISTETHVWLKAIHQVTGENIQTIVRDVLHKHALQEIDKCIVMQGLAQAEGVTWKRRER